MSDIHKNTIYVMPVAAATAPTASTDPFDDVVCVEQVHFHDGTVMDDAAKPGAVATAGTAEGVPVQAHATVDAVEVPEEQSPRWTTGLCDCLLDVNACCENTVCLQCQNSRQYNQLHYGETKIHPITCLGTLAVDALFVYLTYGTVWAGSIALNFHNRGFLRGRYGIDGGKCSDAMATLFCMPCVTCQNYREMSVRNEWPTGTCLVKEPFAVRPPLAVTMGQPEQQKPQQQ